MAPRSPTGKSSRHTEGICNVQRCHHRRVGYWRTRPHREVAGARRGGREQLASRDRAAGPPARAALRWGSIRGDRRARPPSGTKLGNGPEALRRRRRPGGDGPRARAGRGRVRARPPFHGRLARRGPRHEDLQGDGPRGAHRRSHRRLARFGRCPHPGGRRRAGRVRRDLPPQRSSVRSGAADLRGAGAVCRRRRVLAGDHGLHRPVSPGRADVRDGPEGRQAGPVRGRRRSFARRRARCTPRPAASRTSSSATNPRPSRGHARSSRSSACPASTPSPPAEGPPMDEIVTANFPPRLRRAAGHRQAVGPRAASSRSSRTTRRTSSSPWLASTDAPWGSWPINPRSGQGCSTSTRRARRRASCGR